MTQTDERFEWQVRVVALGGHASRAYARNHSIDLGRAASFHESDERPSAIEVLLGALGADLLDGWTEATRRAGLPAHDAELRLRATLDEPLAHLGVVGVTGSAAIAEVSGSFYVGVGAPPEVLETLWRETRTRSPIHATLIRSTAISIALTPIA